MEVQESIIESHYQQYLNLVKLDEATMHPRQRKQLRETFVGACGILFFYLTQDVTKLSADEAEQALTDYEADLAVHVTRTMR